jgi:hypothetical protein
MILLGGHPVISTYLNLPLCALIGQRFRPHPIRCGTVYCECPKLCRSKSLNFAPETPLNTIEATTSCWSVHQLGGAMNFLLAVCLRIRIQQLRLAFGKHR